MTPGIRNMRIALASLFVAGALLSGCDASPTGTQSQAGRPDLSLNGSQIWLVGPDSVTSAGTATYLGHIGYPYPHFQWAARDCPSSLSVTGCTTTWTYASAYPQGDYDQIYTVYLTPDDPSCNNFKLTRNHSYQVRLIASAFAVPADTLYKVTKLCTAELP